MDVIIRLAILVLKILLDISFKGFMKGHYINDYNEINNSEFQMVNSYK